MSHTTDAERVLQCVAVGQRGGEALGGRGHHGILRRGYRLRPETIALLEKLGAVNHHRRPAPRYAVASMVATTLVLMMRSSAVIRRAPC
jgi:hypothetical protein